MNAVLQRLWSDNWYRRSIHLCGATMGLLVYGIAIYAFISEAPDIWREGVNFFLVDAALRLGFGVFIALFTALPYFLASIAARLTGPTVLFAWVAGIVFAIHVWLTVGALFFSKSSTAAIALLFFPVYLCAPIAVIWGLAAILRKK